MCIGMANGGKIRKLNLDAEQALWFFKEELKDGKCDNDCLQCNSMEIAIKALEKQIPKKPLHKELINCGFAWEWTCPNCRIVKVTTEKTFCDDCGQALDWSDTE